jgi:hypothetical protein
MAKKSSTRAGRLDRWRIRLKASGLGTVNGLPRVTRALCSAAEFFGLADPTTNEATRRILLLVLADVVFGQRGRPPGSKKWDSHRLWALLLHRIEVEEDLPGLGDVRAAAEIKKRHPQEYQHTSAEMIRQKTRLQRGCPMRTIFLGLLAAIAIATPVVPASAQVIVDTPVGGVRVGPDRGYDRGYDRYRDDRRMIGGIAVMLAATAALLPSAATTDLSVAFGAATK